MLYRVSGGTTPSINWGDGMSDPAVGPGAAPKVTTVTGTDDDLPFDVGGLPEPSKAPSMQERAKEFGDDPGF